MHRTMPRFKITEPNCRGKCGTRKEHAKKEKNIKLMFGQKTALTNEFMLINAHRSILLLLLKDERCRCPATQTSELFCI